MAKIAKVALVGLALLAASPLGGLAFAGQAPDEKICRNENSLKSADRTTQGACVAMHRRKGNCIACHLIPGIPSGDIAPPLVFIGQRFPDKAQLRNHIADPRRSHPDTVMPPYGTHGILTPEEIDKVVEFLLTL